MDVISKIQKQIISQIISLSKNIFIRHKPEDVVYEHSFFAGRKEFSMLSSGIGIKWWYSETAKTNLYALSSLIIQKHEKFSFDDEEVIVNMITQMFNEICIDSFYFQFELIVTKKKNTLFECRSNEIVSDFGLNIYTEIMNRINVLSTKWLVCYTAPRISGQSLSIEDAGIYIINRYDSESWKKFVSKGYFFNGWKPECNSFADSFEKYDYVFITEQDGTKEGVLTKSIFELRLLFSIIYSFVLIDKNNKLTKCRAEPYDILAQYPLEYGDGNTISMRDNQILLPHYINEHELTDEHLSGIGLWYKKYLCIDTVNKSKISKCGHFINKGMNNNGIDSFINYFISLDALFGVRGDVEKSIIEGIKLLDIDDIWLQKIDYLYQLRNDLVHGGSRDFKEWNRYRKYFNFFKTTPHHDIERLAFLALNKVVDITT